MVGKMKAPLCHDCEEQATVMVQTTESRGVDLLGRWFWVCEVHKGKRPPVITLAAVLQVNEQTIAPVRAAAALEEIAAVIADPSMASRLERIGDALERLARQGEGRDPGCAPPKRAAAVVLGTMGDAAPAPGESKR